MNLLDVNTYKIMHTDVQTNIKSLLLNLDKYQDNFIIKNGDTHLDAQFYKVYNSSYYGMKYPMKERTIALLPFDVIFADYINDKKENSCHINSIHKYGDLSGTQIIETLLKFLKLIGVKKITLTDGAKVNHTKIDTKNIQFDLSLFKLIEKGETFYQRFGFKPICRNVYHTSMFEKNVTVENAQKKYMDAINNITCYSIKSVYIKLINIIDDCIKNNDYDNIKLYRSDSFIRSVNNSIYLYSVENNKQKCTQIYELFTNIVNILNSYDESVLFRDILIITFNSDRVSYGILEKSILKYTDIVGVGYKDNKLMLDFLDNFIMINIIKNMLYVLDL
jgi:hypothetical protein